MTETETEELEGTAAARKEQSKGREERKGSFKYRDRARNGGKVTTLDIKTHQRLLAGVAAAAETVKTTTGNYIQISRAGMKPITHLVKGLDVTLATIWQEANASMQPGKRAMSPDWVKRLFR
jgi:anionic cell wall polymer biosynthesis LytR-Cps2A-Psr (LCP) family protein